MKWWLVAACVVLAGAGPSKGMDAAAPPAVDRIGKAAGLEGAGSWADAMGTLVAAHARGGEEAEPAAARLAALAQQLGEKETGLDDETFAVLRPHLEQAAALPVPEAAMLLGTELRRRGELDAAFRWFRDAAAGGYPPAMVQVGLMYSNGDGIEKNLEKASFWLRPANVKGNPLGKFLLAECFLYGKGPAPNPELAVRLLQEAVEMENPGRAMDLLATCHQKGWGTAPDPAEAARLYRAACRNGFHNGCANLGALYMIGNGIAADPARAIALFEHGVAEGNALAMFFYAAAHWDGLGVPRDRDTARTWFQRAASAGNQKAADWCRDQAWTDEPDAVRDR